MTSSVLQCSTMCSPGSEGIHALDSFDQQTLVSDLCRAAETYWPIISFLHTCWWHKLSHKYCLDHRVGDSCRPKVWLDINTCLSYNSELKILTMKHNVIGGIVARLYLLILALLDGEYLTGELQNPTLSQIHITLIYFTNSAGGHQSSSWHMTALIQLLTGCPT